MRDRGNITAILLGKLKGKPSRDDGDRMGDKPDEERAGSRSGKAGKPDAAMVACADDMLSAIDRGDAEALAEAVCALIELHEEEPEPDEDDRGY